MSNRVVHFEIQVDDVDRAKKFYGDVFGWEFPRWMDDPPYWGVMTAPEGSIELGINGGLLQRSTKAPRQERGAGAYVCTVQVDDFDEIAEKIDAAGGAVSKSKHAIPGMAWQGYFIDTEDNMFGVHQVDESAK